jgi:hypothetical protein
MPRPFYPLGKKHRTSRIGGWVGTRIGLDALAKRTSPCPCRGLNPARPACSLVTTKWVDIPNSKYKVLHGQTLTTAQCIDRPPQKCSYFQVVPSSVLGPVVVIFFNSPFGSLIPSMHMPYSALNRPRQLLSTFLIRNLPFTYMTIWTLA